MKTFDYNLDAINASILARKLTRESCMKCAAQYGAVYQLPESVTRKINTRRKLYNFLEALEFNHSSIQGIFWGFNLAVPRDRKLKPAIIPKSEQKPEWLESAPKFNLNNE